MATSNNVEQVLTAVDLAIKDAMDDTVQRLITELENIIEKNVYNAYNPTNRWYERTMDLKYSWDSDAAKIIGKRVEAELFHDDSLLSYDGDLYQHGNPIRRLQPDGLPTIVNEGRIGNAYGFPQLGAREFWQTFNTYIDNNLRRIMIEELSKRGL